MIINEQVCLPKTHSRWPVTYKKNKMGDRLELLVHMLQNEEEPDRSYFLPSHYYYVRAALEAKFNRHFSPLEVKRIIEDKSWQTSDTPSQTQKLN